MGVVEAFLVDKTPEFKTDSYYGPLQRRVYDQLGVTQLAAGEMKVQTGN